MSNSSRQTAVLKGLDLARSPSLFQPLIRLENGDTKDIRCTDIMRASEGALLLLSRFVGLDNQPLSLSVDNTIALLKTQLAKEGRDTDGSTAHA